MTQEEYNSLSFRMLSNITYSLAQVIDVCERAVEQERDKLVATMWAYYKPKGFTNTAIGFIREFTGREWTKQELEALPYEKEQEELKEVELNYKEDK